MTKFEKIILASLVQDREYFRKVLPFLKSDYFEERVPNVLFSLFANFEREIPKVVEANITPILSM